MPFSFSKDPKGIVRMISTLRRCRKLIWCQLLDREWIKHFDIGRLLVIFVIGSTSKSKKCSCSKCCKSMILSGEKLHLFCKRMFVVYGRVLLDRRSSSAADFFSLSSSPADSFLGFVCARVGEWGERHLPHTVKVIAKKSRSFRA